MTDHDLRESAMQGIGPAFRGESLLPAINHISILEKSEHPALAGIDPDTFDILSLIFIVCAPWPTVFSASHSEGLEFDPLAWKLSVYGWVQSLETPISPEEVGAIRERFGLIEKQIRASQWRRISDGDPVSTEREPGNSQAPFSPLGTKRGSAGLLLALSAIFYAAGYLTRLVFN